MGAMDAAQAAFSQNTRRNKNRKTMLVAVVDAAVVLRLQPPRISPW